MSGGKDVKHAASVPAGLHRQLSVAEEMDEDFEKVFHSDRFDPKTLNPGGTGNVDEGRNYYRTGSVDAAAEGTMEDEGRQAYGPDSPVQDSGIRRVRTDTSFTETASKGHDRHEFPQSRSIMSKSKKKSTDKKHKHPREAARAGLPSIPGGDGDQEDAQEEGETSAASLPWKSKGDSPVLDSEHSFAASVASKDGGASVFSPTEKEEAQDKKKGDGGVKFTLGEEDEDKEEDYSGHRQYRRPSSQIRKHGKKEEEHWKRIGSELRDNIPQPLAEEDASNLRGFDIEDIGTHRFEKAAGMGRHKIKKASTAHFDHDMDVGKPHEKGGRSIGFGFQKGLDHTPHNLFVEMDELEGGEWVEKARWIKYEEDLEAEAGRWGQAHVSSLTFRSLINVRKSVEEGVMLLDLQETDLPGLVHRVVEQLSVEGIIEEDQKPEILRILNYRHKYVQPHSSKFKVGMKRTGSNKSLPGTGLISGWSRNSIRSLYSLHSKDQDTNSNVLNGKSKEKDSTSLSLDMESGQHAMKRTGSGFLKRSGSTDGAAFARKQDILACLEEGTEGCITLVGSIDCERTISAFVRLGAGIVMHNTIEVNLPMRFVFLLLTPKTNYRMDPHECGRAFSTLMANQAFHNVCYRIEGKRELLHAINIFLDDSVVLPPGDWNKQKLLAMADIVDMRKRREERRHAAIEAGAEEPEPEPEEVAQTAKKEKEGEGEKPMRNPLERAPYPFGGLIDDIKCRYPLYWSDIKDGFNPQCLAAIIFIYFAALSGAVAFGGLMGAKTNNDIGIPETLLLSSVTGVLFALFAGCPLIIIGTTGPVLLYDEALYGFSESAEIEYLSWRTWVGIWTLVISLVVAGFQGSTLVKHFTKFTKDIFASLVALLFIFEALRKLYKIFDKHPLLPTIEYCDELANATSTLSVMSLVENTTSLRERREATGEPLKLSDVAKPNVALLSAILMFGTFFIAYFLRIFRNSKVFGRNARRALGDFGVPIAIVIMVLLDLLFADVETEKLNVPDGLTVTNSTKRGWFIPPTGNQVTLPVWAMFAGFLPAILLYLLLFMETHICELIMLEKTKGEKGVGIHMDIVLLSALNCLSGLFGGPWICAATVRAVSHVSALLVVSTTVVPGESAKVIGVRDQRVTALTVSIMLGVSVLMAPILKMVPFAVLFGVFLYMGVSGTNGVQFFDRLMLIIQPVKHHPQVSYVKHVKTWRMVMFTGFQALGLVILWIVKSTPAAIAFPFFVIAMIPFRYLLKFVFTAKELEALDGPNAGKDLSGAQDDEADFFEAAADVPIVPSSAVPLHRSILGIMALPGITIPMKEQ